MLTFQYVLQWTHSRGHECLCATSQKRHLTRVILFIVNYCLFANGDVSIRFNGKDYKNQGHYTAEVGNKQDLLPLNPGLEVIKLFSCSTQLRLKFILLINVKMPTIVGISTFISRINYRLWHSKPSISIYLGYFGIYEQFRFYAQLS